MKRILKTENLLIKMIIVLLAIVSNYLTDDVNKMYISAVFIMIAFISSIVIIKRSFPFFFLSMVAYQTAILIEVWGESYNYTEFTRYLWSSGNSFLGIAIFSIALKSITNKDISEWAKALCHWLFFYKKN